MKLMKKYIMALGLICPLSLISQNISAAQTVENEVVFQDVTTDKAGTLAEVLGQEIETVESLMVRGPINAADFNTLWEGTFHHNLKVINLEYAEIENNTIPDNAFYHKDEQGSINLDSFKPIGLTKIILPDNLVSLGVGAFQYAYNLEDVNLPDNLTEIGAIVFVDCQKLKITDLRIPSGVTSIGGGAFDGCKEITGRLYLPSL